MTKLDGAGRRPPVRMGTLLRIPYAAVSDAVEQGLRMGGHSAIRRPHLTVLQPLFTHPDGARLTDLAAWAHISKPSMGALVQHLESHGYVERTADPADGRAQRVRLTPRGLDAIRIVRAVVVATETTWAAQIGPERLELLRELLRDLALAIRTDDSEL